MNLIEQIQHAFSSFITDTFNASSEITRRIEVTINADEQKQQFGDLSANAAMILAKALGKNPREIAQTIADGFQHPHLEKIEIAGPGFLNLFLTKQALQELTAELFIKKNDFFKLDPEVPKKNFSIEFVSANPTGPLHLGHGRGGIIGDVLGNVVKFLGHKATQEFYVNDAGVQIKKLGMSFKIRCQQVVGEKVELPEDAYHGDYLKSLAEQCIKEHGEKVLEQPDEFFADYAKEHLLELLKTTLAEYGIQFEVWFSEKSLHESGAIEKALEYLQNKKLLYEKEGALWFKATEFGDDKDRVIRKSDGTLTYVAADIAYMKNKVERGADHLIMILGADHHSYVQRLQCVRQAMDIQPPLDVILYQLVKMKASGKLVKMSKRAGNIVTLKGVIDEVGVDVARFFYLHRKADAQLEFDLDLALKKTDENPVYYVQYAYVRLKSILAKAAAESQLANITEKDTENIGSEEALLLKKIASLKPLLVDISTNFQTHLLTYYTVELATLFHAYYAKNRVIDLENIPKSRSRLLLIKVLKDTFETALTILGVSKPEKM